MNISIEVIQLNPTQGKLPGVPIRPGGPGGPGGPWEPRDSDPGGPLRPWGPGVPGSPGGRERQRETRVQMN